MTADQIREMPAGREMDAAVAEHVMGERPPFGHADATVGGGHGDSGGYRLGPRPYSTDAAAAWAEAERLRAAGYRGHTKSMPAAHPFEPAEDMKDVKVWVRHVVTLEWMSVATPGDIRRRFLRPIATADTLPLALCRAALLSIG